MGAGFIRRYIGREPTTDEILAIEGAVLIDRDPPAAINGVNTGLVTLVGEFEDGPFALPTEILSANDLATTFGQFGFNYDGLAGGNPCARGRKADGATSFEYWNGNGFIALVNKKFAGLICVRVDTSVGEVSFTRFASLSGNSDFSFALTSGQTLVFDIGAGNVTATFTGAVATTDSAAGTYPSTFTGGQTMTVKIEGVQYVITFLATDSTQNQVIDRMNAAVGYTAFSNIGGGKTRFNGKIGGTSGEIQIVAVSGAIVTTATGFSAGAAITGTGNVPNIAAITTTNANAVVNAAESDAIIDRDANGAIRIVNTGTAGTGTIVVDSSSTALAFGFPLDAEADAAVGIDGVIPAGTRVQTGAGVEFVTMQSIAVTAANAGPYNVKVRHALDDGTGTSKAVSTLTVLPYPLAVGAFKVTNNLAISNAKTEAQRTGERPLGDRGAFVADHAAGTEVLPLSRSASGGELSRVMLALEVVLAASAEGTTMVFDEVDAGVGGREHDAGGGVAGRRARGGRTRGRPGRRASGRRAREVVGAGAGREREGEKQGGGAERKGEHDRSVCARRAIRCRRARLHPRRPRGARRPAGPGRGGR